MSNLKLDIIYYRTASDFEMEFNLSGCCRMRTFKDKVDSPKGLVSTLARDVARSKIILIVTELSGENSGIPTISRAIGLSLSNVNKAEYGIETLDDIVIPETAVPLVTKSGIYGGCIIESGPQSIIIVSGNRALRHEIMKTYVHNYVFDVGQMLAYEERVKQNGEVSAPPFISKHNDTSADTSTQEEQPTTEDIAENEEIFVSSGDADTSEYNNPFEKANDLSDETDFEQEEESAIVNRNLKKSGRGSNVLLLIIVVLLLIGFGILAYYLIYLPLIQGENIFSGSDNVITEFFNNLLI